MDWSRGRMLVWLALGACTPEPTTQVAVGLAGTPVTLALSGPSRMYAGFPTTLAVTGAPAGATVRFVGSLQAPAAGPCPSELGGACFDVLGPLTIREAVANASGRAEVTFRVPPAGRGDVSLQAAVLVPGAPGTSGVLVLPVTRAGTDTDGDGLEDGAEVGLGTDLNAVDSDGDTLSDGDEVLVHGTDPLRKDTDGDGAWDDVEVLRGLDPFDDDMDGDGLLDGDDPWPTQPGPVDAFTPDDVIVSDLTVSTSDPEFDAQTGRVVWQTTQGEQLWVASVDPATGAFVPANGRGTLVDTGLMPVSFDAQGPEWVNTAAGVEIAYEKQDGPDVVLWRAPETAGGWAPQAMPGRTIGARVNGHNDPGALLPWVKFVRQDGALVQRGWRATTDPSTEQLLPPALEGTVQHWVIGEPRPLLAGIAPHGTFDDVWVLDVQSGWNRFLTDTPTIKQDVYVWRAPELGGEPMAVVAESDAPETYLDLWIYQRIGGVFQRVKRLDVPPGRPHAVSPEPFVVDGHSYVSFVAGRVGAAAGEVPQEVWVAAASPTDPFLRRLSAGTAATAIDPEPYVGGQRPFVYYTEVRQPGGRRITHRCETGL